MYTICALQCIVFILKPMYLLLLYWIYLYVNLFLYYICRYNLTMSYIFLFHSNLCFLVTHRRSHRVSFIEIPWENGLSMPFTAKRKTMFLILVLYKHFPFQSQMIIRWSKLIINTKHSNFE